MEGGRKTWRALGAFFLLACDTGALTGTKQGFWLNPPRLTFGPTGISEHKVLEVTLTNGGRGTITVQSILSSTPWVSVSEQSSFSLAGGESRTMEVAFAPTSEGAISAAVDFVTDVVAAKEEGTSLLPVSGEGVFSYVDLERRAIDFGAVELERRRTEVLTLRNPTAAEASYRLSLDGDDQDEFAFGLEVEGTVAGESFAALPVDFVPLRLGSASATLRMRGCPDCEPRTVALAGMGIASKLEIVPLRVDFGRVAVGASREERVTVRNLGNEPFEFRGAQILGSPGPFTLTRVPSAATNELAPGTSVTLGVTFAPSSLGKVAGPLLEVRIFPRGASAGTSGPKLPLLGEGGQPCILLLPSALEFGAAALGMSVTKSVDAVNRCGETATLEAFAVTVASGGFFSLGSAAAALGVGPGEIVRIPVVFTPKAEGLSQGELTFTARSPGFFASHQVKLTGGGRLFVSCQARVAPPLLDFGAVALGGSSVMGFAVQNEGTTDCFLAGMGLAAGTDPSFQASPVPSQVLLPGATALMRVTFAPSGLGSASGLAEAWVNTGGNGRVTALVSGEGVDGCFRLQPATLDFGTAQLSCGARHASVYAVNECTAAATVDSVAVSSGTSSEFSLASGPAVPVVVPPAGRVEFRVQYQPVDDGEDAAAFGVRVGGRLYTTGLVGRALTATTWTDVFTQVSFAKVDVLFVIDNSGSMTEEQQGLAQNFAAFLAAAQSMYVDYHIGVTTTGVVSAAAAWATCPGGAEGGEGGRLFPVDSSSPRVITPSTPDAAAVFAHNVQVGVCHWDEQGLEAAYRALSDPLASGWNAGFVRPGVKLALIFVSDEDDYSPQPVAAYGAFFKSLKNNDPSQLSVAVVVAPADLSTCPTASSPGLRYIDLARLAGGTVENVCTPDWANSLTALSSSTFNPKRSFTLSARPSNDAAITVRIDGVVRTGWVYDPGTNSVVFDWPSAPPPGSQIEVTYPVGC